MSSPHAKDARFCALLAVCFLGPVTADLPRAVWQPTNSHDRLLDFFAFALAATCKSDMLAACKVASAFAQQALPCNVARLSINFPTQIHRVCFGGGWH